MSTSDEYNGYTNRETWAANLHLSNDEGLYNLALSAVADRRLGEFVTDIVSDARAASDEGHVANPAITMMDREVGSWWRVNWQEVAASFTED